MPTLAEYERHVERFGTESIFEAAVEDTLDNSLTVDELLDLVRYLREEAGWTPTKEQTRSMARGRIRHIGEDWDEAQSRDVERLLGVGQSTLRKYRQELVREGQNQAK